MPAIGDQPLTLTELSSLLETLDPAALLVAPRLLRRIIKHDRKLTHLGLQVPHRKCYVIGRDDLLALATLDELGVGTQRQLPATLLLLYSPDAEKLAEEERGQTLSKYWRLLFHARIHQALGDRLKDVSDAHIRRRIHRLGQTEFNEIRTVLRQEKFQLPPHDDRTVYEEFAAVYLELRFFATPLLARYFPAFEDLGRVDQLLAEDVDAAVLYAATRLPGAPDPVWVEPDAEPMEMPRAPGTSTVIWTGSDKKYQSLVRHAEKASVKGNGVRAAILRARAAGVAAPMMVREAQDRTQAEVNGLSLRLQLALHWPNEELEDWRQAITALLSQTVEGYWPAEARLLYDLQKICVDHERPIYVPDLVEWAYTFFRKPLFHPLPDQPLILAVKHLRVALGRMAVVRVSPSQRQSLSHLLRTALHHAEDRLRERFRPALAAALARVGLQPQNYPERMGRDKLIEELLDRITERGFLNLGDVRDALARNQLKFSDLSGADEFFGGDPLIRVNRELAVGAAGVYRRGEFYLRWLQRGSSLAFGTPAGRWLMLFFLLPILGAIATIVGVQELLHICRLPHHLSQDEFISTMGTLSVFYLLLIHLPAFRRGVVRSLHITWLAVRTVFYDMPAAVFRLPSIRSFLQNWPYKLLVRFVLKPLPFALLIWLVLGLFEATPETAVQGGVAAFVVAVVLLNTRLGRDLEEALIDRTVREWEYIQGLLPGVFRLVMNIFKTILEGIDRVIYTVDEWLRFRGGENRLSLALKTIFGFFWFLLSYSVRLIVNVFFEPTVNPIKHFPVVTMAAKLLVPFWPLLIGTPHHPGLFGEPFQFLGIVPAYLMANLILHSIPGAAGFLVWEFKENWRLYRSNRPRTLRPEVIGHHGETMLRLLKPGFHSGTLPKLYASLRRAERRAYRRGTWKTARRLREKLHHVEESLRHFTERELLAFLNHYPVWTAGPVELVKIEAGSNRIRLELSLTNQGEKPAENLEMSFEEISGWLLAPCARPGWLLGLPIDQQTLWNNAVEGFYKKAGVDLVRERIEACLGTPCPPYDLDDRDLMVWPGPKYDGEVLYDLNEEPIIHPRIKQGRLPDNLPNLNADQILFSKKPINWEAWVAAWKCD